MPNNIYIEESGEKLDWFVEDLIEYLDNVQGTEITQLKKINYGIKCKLQKI